MVPKDLVHSPCRDRDAKASLTEKKDHLGSGKLIVIMIIFPRDYDLRNHTVIGPAPRLAQTIYGIAVSWTSERPCRSRSTEARLRYSAPSQPGAGDSSSAWAESTTTSPKSSGRRAAVTRVSSVRTISRTS